MAESISPSEVQAPAGRQVVKTTVAAQNDQSIATLGSFMSGVRKRR